MREWAADMRGRAAGLLPFAIAVVLPPAGFLLGLFTAQEDRDLGIWIMGIALAAGAVWALFLV